MIMHKAVWIPLMVVGGLAAAVVLAFLVGLLVQLLWNALMPDIFGLPEISYWQAVGLLILGHLLFGGGMRNHSGERIARRKLKQKTDLQVEPDPQQI